MADEALTGDRELVKLHPEVAAELGRHSEGPERDRYALGVLRLGVLALRQARGFARREAIDRQPKLVKEHVDALKEQA
jgi:hypothetical protein